MLLVNSTEKMFDTMSGVSIMAPSREIVKYSSIAQLVEQRTVNPCVPGSSPGRGAKYSKGFSVYSLKPFFFAYDLAHLRHT